MQVFYDKEADAVAIWFKDVKSEITIDVTQDIFIDLDKDGKLAGIEILHASENFSAAELLNIWAGSIDNNIQPVEMNFHAIEDKKRGKL